MTEEQILLVIAGASSLDQLELVRVELVGRKGTLTEQLRRVGELPGAERASAGAEANRLRLVAETALTKRLGELRDVATKHALSKPLDLTAPGTPVIMGHRHPVSLVLDELIEVFW